jgi:hypothetical protein
MAWFVDVTIEAHPMVISNFQVPEASGDFCSRGERFGTHTSNQNPRRNAAGGTGRCRRKDSENDRSKHKLRWSAIASCHRRCRRHCRAIPNRLNDGRAAIYSGVFFC